MVSSIRALISSNPLIKRILNNVGWLSVDRLIEMGGSLIVGSLVARYLGPAQYGTFSFVLSVVALAVPLVLFGVDRPVVLHISKDESQTEDVISSAMVLRLAAALVTIPAVIIAMLILRPGDTLVLSMVSILSITHLFKVAQTCKLWFEANINAKQAVLATRTAFIIGLIVKSALVIFKASLIWFAIANVIEGLIASVLLFQLFMHLYKQKYHKRFAFHAHAARIKQLAKEAAPLIVASFAVTVYMRIDQVMLAKIQGDEAAGVYSAAVRFAEIWYFLPMVIVNSVFPAVVKLREINKELYWKRINQILALLALVGSAAIIVMLVASKPAVLILFGPAYTESISVLILLMFSLTPVAYGLLESVWLIAEGKNSFVLFRQVFGAVANVILNILLIPQYSYYGAAIATVVSYALANVAVNILQAETRAFLVLQLRNMLVLPAIAIWVTYIRTGGAE